MTEERIEQALNRCGFTLTHLPKDFLSEYSPEGTPEFLSEALKACNLPENETTFGNAVVGACLYGRHLKDVTDILVAALEETVSKLQKAKYRLNTWGDIHYVKTIEEKP